MARSKVAFVCNECGAEFPRWQGQCSECREWNTISEVRLAPATSGKSSRLTGYAGEQQSQKTQQQRAPLRQTFGSTGQRAKANISQRLNFFHVCPEGG